MSAFPSLRVEGGLFSPDLFENLLHDQLPGQKAQDFGLTKQRNLTTEIAAVYHDARALWQVFRNRLEALPEDDLATSETRTFWMLPFLRLLGYDLEYQARAFELDGLTFAISHALIPSPSPQHPVPAHIVGWRQELGRVAPSGRPRLSPHALVQEYLNRSEALWGLVTNGRILRLLRSSTFIRRQAYLEFDLEALFEQERFADFVLLYRLLHRSRLPKDGRAEDCLLEKYYQQSIEQGGRVRERLREGVERCLNLLANGFLAHPQSANLRDWVSQEGALAFYRQLLRLVYRFLFLLVAEERGLVGSNPLYLNHYGISRLRRLCENRAAYTDDADLWLGLRALWKIFQDEQLAGYLAVPPLNGELFAHQELDEALISNRDLLEAFWYLAYYENPPRRINYAALDTEELGSVYESLLDYHPAVVNPAGQLYFELAPGSERKSTGSYYTPPQLVNELIRSALEPLIAERLKDQQTQQAREHALLSIKVCDPACGSGHFLLAAARRLGRELARIRSSEDEPAPEQMRLAVRDVIAHCLYGVDKNPLAVELARVALWLEGHAEGKPLTFLEHRIRHGDSLVGVFDLSVLHNGLPDEAFNPLVGDDKNLVAALKRQNKSEREGQYVLFGWDYNLEPHLNQLTTLFQQIDAISDDSPEQVRRKRERYQSRWNDPHLRRQQTACNLWTAAFFQAFSRQGGNDNFITTDTIRRALSGQPVDPQLTAQAEALSAGVGFFHWPLEFPEVFLPGETEAAAEAQRQSGFDLILANPPWERIKLQEQEFFAAREPHIANATNAAARKRLIERLPAENPVLWDEYRRALHIAESASRFLRASGDYPLTARGDINTYSVFAERIRRLLSPQGRAGVILPTGIATDANNQHFFADLVDKRQIISLFDFENREKLFPAVDSRMKFCLLTLSGAAVKQAQFVFFATRVEHLRDESCRFSLNPADLALLNPNTRTLPVFRTRVDADLTRAIYRRVPVLVNKRTGENPWGVRFLAMFHMANDSHLFRTREQLESEGYRLAGNRFVRSPLPQGESPHPNPLPPGEEIGEGRGEVYLPLYEAKMIWLYDHRYSAYAGVNDRSSTQLPALNERQHADPAHLTIPWYWVAAGEAQARLWNWRRAWLLGFRDIARSTDERTAVFSLLPRVGVGNSLPILLPDIEHASILACLVANLSALAFDWVVRQKIAGVNMNFFYVEQFPVLPPSAYTPANLAYILPRVLELVYTAWDIKPFADEVWREASPSPNPLPQGEPPHPNPLPRGEGRGEGGSKITSLARELRKNATDAEQRLWQALRDRQLNGLKFRRQHPIGRFILDFYCHEKRLAIEIDGAHHAEPEQRAHDEERIATLAARGITVLRFWNHEVLNHLEGTLQTILSAAENAPSFPAYSDLQEAILRQWEENAEAAGGGHAWHLPEWIKEYPEIETDPQKGIPLPPFKWDEARRAVIRAELDACYARLYGLTRKQLRYILDPADLTPRELEDILDPWEEVDDPLDPQGYAERCAQSDFPGETFRVMKEKEIQRYGEYRTRRLALEAWERLKDIPSSSSNFQTEAAKESLPQAHLPPAPVGERESSRSAIMEKKEITEQQTQPSESEPTAAENESEYSIYRCQECGKLVLGFDREMHRQKSHSGRKVHFEAIKKKRG